jgi:uracil-DNA glycosylase family 4
MLTGRKMIPPSGSLETAKIVIVGEQPGKMEIKLGRPFVGPAGQELLSILHSLGINKNDCYFTNVIKDFDQKLSQYISFSRKGPEVSKTGQAYIDYLLQELKDFKGPIVALGNVALYALTERTGITKWRGSILKHHLENYIIPTFHPATVIPPKNQYLNRILITFDIKKAKDIYQGDYSPLERKFKIEPSIDECIQTLIYMYNEGLKGKNITFDIEIHNMEISCISFSDRYDYAISIPFLNSEGNCLSIRNEIIIMQHIAKILENPNIKKVGQNLCFDTHFLLRRYGIHTKNCHDTMIAQQILMPEFPKGLDFITSIHTDLPYYKDEGKKFFKVGGNFRTLWQYNAMDSIVCSEAFPKQLKDLEKQGNIETYERQRRLIEPLVFMMEHGIKVDVAGMKKYSLELREQIKEHQAELNKLAKQELNVNSPKQLKHYLYIDKGHIPYKDRSSGSITTNNLAMKRLKRKGCLEADLILKIRSLRKLVSTYMPLDDDGNLTKISSDGRIRCFYNPVGTRYSRISSSKSIFGEGMNMQNWPKPAKRFFLADDGYIYYAFDLAQAENRIVAYVAGETKMIEAFENHRDVHRLTASLIFNKSPEKITDDHDEIKCLLGDGTHSERFWGKKANHGLNYDLGYRAFALLYEIPENEGRFIVERYHQAYPGVRQSFHTYIRRCLSDNRTITNLMGRKTLFLDKWGDSLFKEAYSCIPQGTVGDLVNEQAILPIYYDDYFNDCQLLEQVHDSVGFQLPLPSETNNMTWEKHAEILFKIKKNLEKKLVFKNREFFIPADLSIGLDFYNTDEIKGHKFPMTKEDLAKNLKTIHTKLLESKNGETSKGLD